MVITAVAVGTRGDVNPLAELGEEMIKRGHEFRILTSEAFHSLIESKGVTFLKLNTDADHVMQYLVAEYKTSIDFMKGMFKLKKENPGFMEQTVSAIRGSDLVMYGTCGAFAYHAAELLKIPCARVFYSPMDPTSQYSLYSDEYDSKEVLKSYNGLPEGMNLMTMIALNKWRVKNGLPKWRIKNTYKEMNGRKLLTFYPTSRVLMKPDPAWGGHIHVTGYWYHPDEAEREYQPESDRVNTDKLYFIGNVPYSYIFGKVRAVVHHGGNTTNGLGLRAGLPTLVIPLALDQYFYGRMDHRIGAGPAPLYIRKRLCSVDEIKASLNDLVSGKYGKGAIEASKSILHENGVIEAADAIEASLRQFLK